MRPALGIIGAGRVGQTLARAWFAAGYTVRAVASRTYAHAEALAAYVGAEVVPAHQVVGRCDLTLLSVSDNAIASVAEQIGANASGIDLSGKGIVHASGALDHTVLRPLQALGMHTGSLHPALPFADVDTALRSLAGATFAVEAEHPLLADWLDDLVTIVGGRVLRVPSDRKGLYHAALVMASNYTVTLYATARSLLLNLGDEQTVDEAAIDAALQTLMTGTFANIREQGVPWALTGPLTRADSGTIEAHLMALDGHMEVRDAYIALARLTTPLLRARGVPESFLDALDDLMATD